MLEIGSINFINLQNPKYFTNGCIRRISVNIMPAFFYYKMLAVTG